jgi:hypothetical protein
MVIDEYETEIIHLAVSRLIKLSQTDCDLTPEGAVKSDVADPTAPFIKDEPHPLRKVGRERIVIGVSIVDQIVELMLVGNLIASIHDAFPRNGILSGVGFSDELTHVLCQEYLRRCDLNPDLVCFGEDGSGWCRTFSLERAMQAVEDWLSSCVHKSHGFVVALRNRTRIIADPLYVVSSLSLKRHTRSLLISGDSTQYVVCKRKIPGGMLSGSRWTTIGNGAGRVDSLLETGACSPMAAGDDGLGWRDPDISVEELSRRYAALGIVIRDVNRFTREEFEFCSHHFDVRSSKSWLTSWPKALYRLATRKSVSVELVESFLHEVRHHPRRSEFKKACDQILLARPAAEPDKIQFQEI